MLAFIIIVFMLLILYINILNKSYADKIKSYESKLIEVLIVPVITWKEDLLPCKSLADEHTDAKVTESYYLLEELFAQCTGFDRETIENHSVEELKKLVVIKYYTDKGKKIPKNLL